MYTSYRLNPSLVQSSLYRGSSPLFGVFEAIAVTVALDDVAAMREPVERGPGQAFAAQDLHPLLERQVGGEDQAGAFVSGADHIEEKFGAELAGRDVAEFIEDQKIEFGQLTLEGDITESCGWRIEKGDVPSV
mgnify:CR=1 FL=1